MAARSRQPTTGVRPASRGHVRARIDGRHQQVEFRTAVGARDRQTNGVEQGPALLPRALPHLLGRLPERLARQPRPCAQLLRERHDHRPAGLGRAGRFARQVLDDRGWPRRLEDRPQPFGRIRQLVDGASHERHARLEKCPHARVGARALHQESRRRQVRHEQGRDASRIGLLQVVAVHPGQLVGIEHARRSWSRPRRGSGGRVRRAAGSPRRCPATSRAARGSCAALRAGCRARGSRRRSTRRGASTAAHGRGRARARGARTAAARRRARDTAATAAACSARDPRRAPPARCAIATSSTTTAKL